MLYSRIDKTYTTDEGQSFITECPCGCKNGWKTKGILPILIRCLYCKNPIYPDVSIYEKSKITIHGSTGTSSD
jgi:hypothetical protein